MNGYIYRSPPPACQCTGGVPIPPPARSGGGNRPLGSAAGPVLTNWINISEELNNVGKVLYFTECNIREDPENGGEELENVGKKFEVSQNFMGHPLLQKKSLIIIVNLLLNLSKVCKILLLQSEGNCEAVDEVQEKYNEQCEFSCK